METNGEASLMRIFISNTDKFKHAPLYEMMVFAAKRYGLAGATVLRGTMGFGSGSVVRSSKFWEITGKLPVVIEIVDETQKIDAFAEKIKPWFDKLRYGCMITVEKVNIVFYKHAGRKGYFDK
jgi:PII-like signaling protein